MPRIIRHLQPGNGWLGNTSESQLRVALTFHGENSLERINTGRSDAARPGIPMFNFGSNKFHGAIKVMPKLLQTIYEIAVAKGRDVLCVVFGDMRLPPPYYDGMLKALGGKVIEQPPWETHPTRQQVLSWLNENSVGYLETALPMPGWSVEEGYGGALYLDVPFDTTNPDYRRLAAFLENPDQTPRLPGMTFWAVPLDRARQEVGKSSDKHD